jgi:hypothetical protein
VVKLGRLASPIPLADFRLGFRVVRALPAFLKNPVTPEEARATIRRRLQTREADFLSLARRAIYDHPASPYLALLRLAGCEYGDIERLVGSEGLEGALRLLFEQGVYLTVEEFKGRRPVVRGSARLAVDPTQLRNPLTAAHYLGESGGTGGLRTPFPIDLAWLRNRAINTTVCLDACGGLNWVHARWGVPGLAVVLILEYYLLGSVPARWFTQIDPTTPGLPPRYRWSARLMRLGGLLAGVRLPGPVFVPLEDPLPIARWMEGVLRSGRTPHLHTPSSATRLCRAALAAGIDLRGAQFSMGGEALTEARMAPIRAVGARGWANYGSMEADRTAFHCLAAEQVDEHHMMHDTNILTQPGAAGPARGLPPEALLLSSLRPSAPLILLNASMGDRAIVTTRDCGCPLERLGWTTHLHTVRSFQKLTSGGMTFLDTDIVGVLEEKMPARFGGGPIDYQLLEEESPDGKPRLRLLVHPRIGPLDPHEVGDTFLTLIGSHSGTAKVMELQWRQGGYLEVERLPPKTNPVGKTHPLYVLGRPVTDADVEVQLPARA